MLSYDSSPAFTIDGQGGTTTSALLDTCFRQVEYAGVLAGAENPEGAQALVDFMLSRPFQEALPDSMYVFPVDAGRRAAAATGRRSPSSPSTPTRSTRPRSPSTATSG